ncbi:hypothetical protein [Feifania hominis]|uniref:Uncharacterized protein n=1 Tax=Feifania hominis TaxID=2763660 RepID=A0A926HUB8_9FIRM|nr:hypothetical protein [Feifania hominis]MBC8536749.1 hypothetical protein [Feifania hominis]
MNRPQSADWTVWEQPCCLMDIGAGFLAGGQDGGFDAALTAAAFVFPAENFPYN